MNDGDGVWLANPCQWQQAEGSQTTNMPALSHFVGSVFQLGFGWHIGFKSTWSPMVKAFSPVSTAPSRIVCSLLSWGMLCCVIGLPGLSRNFRARGYTSGNASKSFKRTPFLRIPAQLIVLALACWTVIGWESDVHWTFAASEAMSCRFDGPIIGLQALYIQ
jgi:hypothetical protein